MGVFEDGLSYLAQNIGYIVTIIGGIALGTKYVIAEVNKRADRLDKKILGPDRDGKPGKGGLLDELRQEILKENKHNKEVMEKKIAEVEKDLTNKITDSQKELLFEFQKVGMRIDYMSKNVGRMEKHMQKISRDTYIADTGYDENDGFGNSEFGGDGDVNRSRSDNYNKRQKGREH